MNKLTLDRLGLLLAGRSCPPPSLHSAQYYPQPEPTIKTGVTVMTAAALELVGKK